ncbi:signal recognition particle protein [Gemmatimonas groenlandica]|uniref:Signal recognition particle protein n=1 Tax=Gemmatimonas groenlandica TaxID=2732249 RepID=A0A6M4IKU8_9BACT|nr:signal recognition particle protein [Gemmatimonas groenlandica]QJR34498.1 signal recognition particle protein [Gemmatimonas groenlandica]
MFDELSDKLGNVFAKLRGRGVLTDADIKEGLREVRRVLLEADVNFSLTREFLERVEKKAVGVLQIKTIQPAQQLVKIVHDELTAMLGERREGLKMSTVPPTIIMMVGLQGSGKTTTAGKLARKLMLENRSTRLVAADVYRPAAIDQLETLGKALNVPVYADRDTKDVVKIAKAGIDQGVRARDRVVIIDTAGRLQIDADMMDELKKLKAAIKPDEILFVADGMTGQEAVKIAQGFDEALNVTGVILTKLDGDARGGAALSIYGVLKKPIKYIGVGEKPDALEEFHPERMAGRILQMGDIVSLVEKAQETFDATEAKKLEKKVRKEGMDLEDFLTAMRQMQKLGPLENLLKLLPGVNSKMLKDVKMDPKRMKHIEAIVLSMTPQERKKPEILNGSRRARIAKGCGRPVSEVNKLLEQFREMQKMMKKMGGGPGGAGGKGGGGMPPDAIRRRWRDVRRNAVNETASVSSPFLFSPARYRALATTADCTPRGCAGSAVLRLRAA